MLRGHGLEVASAIASLVFVAGIGVYTIVVYRIGIEPWLANVLPPSTARWIGWVVAGVITLTTIAAVIGDPPRAWEADATHG